MERWCVFYDVVLDRLRKLLKKEKPLPLDGPVCLDVMKRSDVKEVHKIESVSYLTPWSASTFYRACENENEEFWVVRIQDKIVGYAGFRKEEDVAHIINVTVHPDYRRRGIACLLLRKLFMRIGASGYDRVYLEVRETNLAAQSLYRKFGFKPVRKLPSYYFDTGEDAVVMELNISQLGLGDG